MYRPAPPARGKVIAAVTVSVLVHSLLGLAWWAGADRCAVAGPMSSTAVDGPDDRETTFVLREPPAERPRPSPPLAKDVGATNPPAALPPSVTGPGPRPLDPGALAQPGISPARHDSLPNSAAAKPLHERMERGKAVVYVLDRSASMGPDALLVRAVAAIKVSLEQLGPDVRFGIVAYNGGASVLSAKLLSGTAENARLAGTWLDQLTAEGSSKHVIGMREGLWLRPDVVILLTDADDLDEDEVRAIAKVLRAPIQLKVAIFGTAQPAGETPLERLAHDRGGAIQYFGP